LKDQKQIRVQVLERALRVCSLQLTQSECQADELASALPLAKSPHERTSMNIVLDDQRKVIKALKRLQADVSEILEKES
jgi:hypothetical protein